MSVVRSGVIAPAFFNSAARIGVLGIAVLSAGCASQQANTAYPGERLGGPPQRVAAAPKIEIEDDGLPAQIAPRHRPPVKDDPSEPWSPNYGGAAPAKPASPPPAKAAAVAAPPRFVATTTASMRLSAVDEEAVIRRAIAEHEMRRSD